MFGKLSSRHTLIARSGLEKSLTITGVMRDSQSSSDRFFPIFITEANTFGPPPPNSIDFRSSGRTLTQKNSSGKSSETSSSSLTWSAETETLSPQYQPQKFFPFAITFQSKVLKSF